MIEATGAKYRPAPINYQALLEDPDVRSALFSLRGKIRVARQSVALQRRVAQALWEIGLDERPDLILFNVKASVMTLAARRLGIPALPTALQPILTPTGDFPVPLFGLPSLGRSLNRQSYSVARWLMRLGEAQILKSVRASASAELAQPGLLIDGHLPDGGPAPSLQGYSGALVPTPKDWPATAWPCGYWFSDPDPGETIPEALRRFLSSGPPPVYVGFGSMPSRDPDSLTDIVLKALKKTGQRAVLSRGWGGLSVPDLPADIRDRVFMTGPVPHSWLFPMCLGIVHHGGAGTTHEALRWGKPSLVCPVFGDQPFWGERVHRSNAGPPPLPQGSITIETLTKAFLSLDVPAFAAGADKASRIMAQEPGARGTAEQILTFLETRKAA